MNIVNKKANISPGDGSAMLSRSPDARNNIIQAAYKARKELRKFIKFSLDSQRAHNIKAKGHRFCLQAGKVLKFIRQS